MSEKKKQNTHGLEDQLILECSQTKNTEFQTEQITNILQQPLNWERIIKVAERNSVLPLISWNLLQNFKDLLPKEVTDHLHRYFLNHTKQNLTLLKHLVTIIKLFKENNIPLISFKGPLLAMQAYGNLALRQFNDLDILIQPSQLDAGIKLLISAGFSTLSDLRWFEKKNWYLSRKKDVVFVNENSDFILELHWKLSGAHFAYPVEAERLWQQMETKQLSGTVANVLHINDLFIYLCLHGARHSWERLSWICDLNELIRSENEIDWLQIDLDAKRLGCENILKLGLFLVHKLFGTKIPVADWQEIENDLNFRELAEQIEGRLFNEKQVDLAIADRYLYHLKLKEKKWDKWKLHLHYNFWYLQLIFSPNSADRDTFNLPSWINPVYFVIRPIRLIYTYFIKSH